MATAAASPGCAAMAGGTLTSSMMCIALPGNWGVSLGPNSLPDIIFSESHLLWVPGTGLKGKAQALLPLLFLSDLVFSDAFILLGPKSAH